MCTWKVRRPGALIQARQALERDLRRAVLQKEFVVHYQPLVNLEFGRSSASRL